METRNYTYLDKSINWKNSRWTKIYKQTNPYMLEAGYDVCIAREPSYWIMKRQGGQMVSGIDAKSSELIAKYPRLKKVVENLK